MQQLLLLFTLLFLPPVLMAQNLNSGALSHRLLGQIETAPHDFHSIYLVLSDKIDVRAMDANFYRKKATLKERTFDLITQLQAKASRTQAPLIQTLKQSKWVKQSSIQAFWIANVVFVEAKQGIIAMLSQMDEVEWIDLNSPLELEEFKRANAPPTLLEPNSTEPGLRAINAPALWKMGYTGYGQTAFILDTGTIPHHPALRSQYKGNHVPEHQAWFDLNNQPPFDCNDHGTHVCGTVMGLDRMNNDTIGVAYNANWLASPHISCSHAENYPGTLELIAAFQWAMNPDSNLHTIHDMPDAINNSWHDPSIEDDCTSLYLLALNALEAAGVAVVFSAGNSGPDPSTITKPHNINLDLVNTFAVGALNANGSSPNFPIADFSSRGPSACGGESSLLIKPEVSAPGVNVRSSVRDGTYDLFSGTSMAAPHTTGAILLLKEAFPELTGAELKLALYFTCKDLGPAGEDNTFGMGIINVLDAYNYLIEQGHTPIMPVVNNDIMLIDLETKLVYCENKVDYKMVVENAGNTTINRFEWVVQLTQENQDNLAMEEIFAWEGTLAPGERQSIEGALGNMPQKGSYEMVINLMRPNGEEDDRDLNDVLKTPLNVTDKTLFPIGIAGEVQEVCANTQVLLRSQFEGDADVKWYSAAEGGELLGEGNTYLTAILDSTTTFYAQADIRQKVGMESPDIGEQQLDSVGGQIIFDAHLPFILKSFTIYTEERGGRIFQMKTTDGTPLGSRVVTISEPGVHRVEVNYNVPQGNNIILEQLAGKPLIYTSEGANYPYQIENLVTIKGSNAPNDTLGNYYYYCYDWEVEYTDFCGRSPIRVEVVDEDNLPEAHFNASSSLLDLQDGGEVNFTNTSSNASTWFWEFGDGTTSTAENPNHIYQNAGIYTVSLTALHPSGCPAFASMTIEVTDSNITATESPFLPEHLVQVFPNPTTAQLVLQLMDNRQKMEQIEVFNAIGMKVKYFGFQEKQGEKFNLNLEDLNSGLYYLVIQLEGKQLVKKVLKL